MLDSTLEDVIRSNLNFIYGSSAKGWHIIYCEVCGDGSRTKGPRGGWYFENEAAFYHCFNCNIDANFDPNRERPYSKEMYRVLTAFGIPKNEHEAIAYKRTRTGKDAVVIQKKEQKLQSIPIPSHFYKLSDAQPNNLLAKKAREYLQERKISPDSYPFYLSTGLDKSGDPREEAIAKSLTNRLIIPAFRGDDMIYWQARFMGDNTHKKYINPSIPKSNVIYGYNKLFKDLEKPLFVTEGFFDSHHLDGVAVLGNEISALQLEILNKSPREKILVPDKKLDKKINDKGNNLAIQALAQNWKIAFPEIGSCTDVTSAIQKYGKIYVFNSIMENIHEGFSAKIKLEFW